MPGYHDGTSIRPASMAMARHEKSVAPGLSACMSPKRSEVKVSAGTQPSQRSRAWKATTNAQPAQQGDEETMGRQLGRLTFSPPHHDNFGIQPDDEAHEEDGDQ